MRQVFASLLIFWLTSAAQAQVTVPHTFTAGAAARASEVNANFSALATAINDLATRLSAVENPTVTAASVAGTYKYLSLGIAVNATQAVSNAGILTVRGATWTGTMVLNAGGTASFTTIRANSNSRIAVTGGTPATVTIEHLRETGTETNPATWALSNGEVVITDYEGVVMNFVAASPRLLIATARQLGGLDSYSLEILIRQ